MVFQFNKWWEIKILQNDRIETVPCDVTSDYEIIEKSLQSHQPFHMLVNNAGIALIEPFMAASAQNIDKSVYKSEIVLIQFITNDPVDDWRHLIVLF